MNNSTGQHCIINNAQHKALSVRLKMLMVHAGEGHAGASLTSLVLLPSWPMGQQPTASCSTQVRVHATVSRAEEDSLCNFLISWTDRVKGMLCRTEAQLMLVAQVSNYPA